MRHCQVEAYNVGQAEAFFEHFCAIKVYRKIFSHRFTQIRSDKRKGNQNSPLR